MSALRVPGQDRCCLRTRQRAQAARSLGRLASGQTAVHRRSVLHGKRCNRPEQEPQHDSLFDRHCTFGVGKDNNNTRFAVAYAVSADCIFSLSLRHRSLTQHSSMCRMREKKVVLSCTLHDQLVMHPLRGYSRSGGILPCISKGGHHGIFCVDGPRKGFTS